MYLIAKIKEYNVETKADMRLDYVAQFSEGWWLLT